MPGRTEADFQFRRGTWSSVLEATLVPELKDLLLQRIQVALHRSRAVAYREATRSVDQERSADRRRVLSSIAEELELVAQASSDEPQKQSLLFGKLLNLILAGLAYEGAASPANAQLLAKRAAQIWENLAVAQEETNDPIALLEDRTFKCALALLCKDLYLARSTARGILDQLANLEEAAIARFNEGDYTRADLEHFVGQTLLARGVIAFSQRLLSLDGGAAPDLGYFDDAAEMYEHLGNSTYWLLARLLGLSLREAALASTALILPQFFRGHEELRYVASLLSDRRRIFQLWPSQLHAAHQGVFDADTTRVALSLPTSAGKTLIAESAIARELLKDPGARCVYLAPTRALVSEVERTLKRSLKPLGIEVSQISAASELSTIEAEVALENRLLCLTPEKLDVFLRLGHEILSSIRLIVVDEGQLLEEAERGQLLEFAIVKLQLRFPGTRILFLSAVIPNIEEVASWLGAQEHRSRHIRSNWRPTRLRIGGAVIEPIQAEELETDPILQAVNSMGRRPLKRCRVRYTDGKELDAFFIRYGEASNYRSNQQIVVALAKAYARRGTVLVLSTSKSRAEEVAELLGSGTEPLQDPTLESLAQKIRREIDPEFPLAEQVRRGIAYHHGDLPPRVRYRLEQAARENKLNFIVATTTLAEGVNLPISTLVVDDLNFRYESDGRWLTQRMSARKFWNLAGRAGRALIDTEGHVIIFNPDRFFETPEEKRAFLTPDVSALEPVESVFLQLLKLLEGRYRQLLSFDYDTDPFERITAVQNFLLALLDLEDVLANGLDPDLAIDKIIKHSLITYQSDASPAHKKHFRNFVRWGLGIVRGYADLPTQQKRLIVRLGLSIKSASSLIARFETMATEELRSLLQIRKDGGLVRPTLERLYSEVFAVTELGPKRHQEAPHAAIAVDWISGSTVGEVATNYFVTEKRSLAEASNYLYGTQSLNGAWGISAVVAVIGFLLHQRGVVSDPELPDHEASLLPAYSAYGVDSPPAAIFAARGVERIDARILADWFYAEQRIQRGTLVPSKVCVDWLRSRPPKRVRERIEEHRASFDEDLLEVIEEMH